jgi:hypothetical protein
MADPASDVVMALSSPIGTNGSVRQWPAGAERAGRCRIIESGSDNYALGEVATVATPSSPTPSPPGKTSIERDQVKATHCDGRKRLVESRHEIRAAPRLLSGVEHSHRRRCPLFSMTSNGDSPTRPAPLGIQNHDSITPGLRWPVGGKRGGLASCLAVVEQRRIPGCRSSSCLNQFAASINCRCILVGDRLSRTQQDRLLLAATSPLLTA